MNHKIKAFIVLSVLLNLLMGGVIAGHYLQRMESRDGFSRVPESAQLSPEKKALIESTLNQIRDEGKQAWAAMRESREILGAILKAESFDPRAYDAQTEKMRQLMQQMQERKSETIKTLAGKLTPEERAVLAEMLRRTPYRHEWKQTNKKPVTQ